MEKPERNKKLNNKSPTEQISSKLVYYLLCVSCTIEENRGWDEVILVVGANLWISSRIWFMLARSTCVSRSHLTVWTIADWGAVIVPSAIISCHVQHASLHPLQETTEPLQPTFVALAFHQAVNARTKENKIKTKSLLTVSYIHLSYRWSRSSQSMIPWILIVHHYPLQPASDKYDNSRWISKGLSLNV